MKLQIVFTIRLHHYVLQRGNRQKTELGARPWGVCSSEAEDVTNVYNMRATLREMGDTWEDETSNGQEDILKTLKALPSVSSKATGDNVVTDISEIEEDVSVIQTDPESNRSSPEPFQFFPLQQAFLKSFF